MTFIIPGEPVGKQRPRVVRRGSFVQTYTPEKTVNYENLVKLEWQRQCGSEYLGEGPMQMRIQAYYAIPKSVSRKRRAQMVGREILPTKKPDADNLAKCVADALSGLAYKDDAQIVWLEVRKWYDEQARVVVEIEGMSEVMKGESGCHYEGDQHGEDTDGGGAKLVRDGDKQVGER